MPAASASPPLPVRDWKGAVEGVDLRPVTGALCEAESRSCSRGTEKPAATPVVGSIETTMMAVLSCSRDGPAGSRIPGGGPSAAHRSRVPDRQSADRASESGSVRLPARVSGRAAAGDGVMRGVGLGVAIATSATGGQDRPQADRRGASDQRHEPDWQSNGDNPLGGSQLPPHAQDGVHDLNLAHKTSPIRSTKVPRGGGSFLPPLGVLGVVPGRSAGPTAGDETTRRQSPRRSRN